MLDFSLKRKGTNNQTKKKIKGLLERGNREYSGQLILVLTSQKAIEEGRSFSAKYPVPMSIKTEETLLIVPGIYNEEVRGIKVSRAIEQKRGEEREKKNRLDDFLQSYIRQKHGSKGQKYDGVEKIHTFVLASNKDTKSFLRLFVFTKRKLQST